MHGCHTVCSEKQPPCQVCTEAQRAENGQVWEVTDFFFTLLVFWLSKMYSMELFMLRNRAQAALLLTFTCFILPSCPSCACSGWLRGMKPLLRMCASLLEGNHNVPWPPAFRKASLFCWTHSFSGCLFCLLEYWAVPSHQEPTFGVILMEITIIKAANCVWCKQAPLFSFLALPWWQGCIKGFPNLFSLWWNGVDVLWSNECVKFSRNQIVLFSSTFVHRFVKQMDVYLWMRCHLPRRQ